MNEKNEKLNDNKQTYENNNTNNNEMESRDTVTLDNSDDENEIKLEKIERTWCQRTFGKMAPGSLRGSIFNMCILSLGTGLLAQILN